jgi:TRAP-type mannitol/chloroaromatic compound transport system substrate-binding protein
MQNIIIGMVIGAVLGLVAGATLIAPRMKPQPSVLTGAEQTRTAGPAVDAQQPKGLITRPAVRMKMASAFSTGSPVVGALAKRLERELLRFSGGEIEMRVYEPGALVPHADALDAVAAGTIDAAFGLPSDWAAAVPALTLFGTGPFGPGTDEFLAWFEAGGGKRLLEEIVADRGVHPLVCGISAPPAAGWFRREIHSIADLHGLPMAIDGIAASVMQRLGVETRPLTGGAVFVALETGTIDAAVGAMPAIDARLDFHKFAKHYYFPGWQQPTTVLVLLINHSKWRNLTGPQQGQIETVCGDNVRLGRAESGAVQFPALKNIVANGVRLHRWPSDVRDALEQAWQTVANEHASANSDFRRVWRSQRAFHTEFAIWDELSRP